MNKKQRKGKIVIDKQLCKGCKYCILACPNGAIMIETEFNTSGYYPAWFGKPEKCTGCAMCAVVCPDIAIEVWQDE